MSVTPLNWRAAGALAEQLLAGWQRRGEPGGAITLFDAEQLRATACAGPPIWRRIPLHRRQRGALRLSDQTYLRRAGAERHRRRHSARSAPGELLPALQPALADVTVGGRWT